MWLFEKIQDCKVVSAVMSSGVYVITKIAENNFAVLIFDYSC